MGGWCADLLAEEHGGEAGIPSHQISGPRQLLPRGAGSAFSAGRGIKRLRPLG
jgi:hypothetical protein